MTRPGMAEAVRLSPTHAAICIRARSRPATYSSTIGGRLDTSASRWRERAQSKCDSTNPNTYVPGMVPGRDPFCEEPS